MSRTKTLGAIALVFAFASVAAGADKPAKLRVLLLSGKNNHNWKQTTPALLKIFKTSEQRFCLRLLEKLNLKLNLAIWS